MRILVFFDLPTETLEDRRNYRHFRKFLMSSGYIMLQESVYVKLALNKTVVDSSVAAIRNHKPPKRRCTDSDGDGKAVCADGVYCRSAAMGYNRYG